MDIDKAREKAMGILLCIKNAERRHRDEALEKILSDPDLIGPLVAMVSEEDAFLSDRACWILELVCTADAELLCPYADEVIGKLESVTSDRQRRPLAKICSLLSASCKERGKTQCEISKSSVKSMLSWSFDQLISERPVAIKVFAMQTVYQLRDFEPWIRNELRNILRDNMSKESPGYRARAQKILAEI